MTRDPRRERKRLAQQNRRIYRKLLGLCSLCTKKTVPGQSRCAAHQARHRIYAHAQTERLRRQRGWKFQKVEV